MRFIQGVAPRRKVCRLLVAGARHVSVLPSQAQRAMVLGPPYASQPTNQRTNPPAKIQTKFGHANKSTNHGDEPTRHCDERLSGDYSWAAFAGRFNMGIESRVRFYNQGKHGHCVSAPFANLVQLEACLGRHVCAGWQGRSNALAKLERTRLQRYRCCMP